MSAGTKIFLALFGLFILMVVFYYGLWPTGSSNNNDDLALQTDHTLVGVDAMRDSAAGPPPAADPSRRSTADRSQLDGPARQPQPQSPSIGLHADRDQTPGNIGNNHTSRPSSEIEMGGVLPSDGLGIAANRPAIIDPTTSNESPGTARTSAEADKHVDLVPVAQYIVEEGDTLTGIAARWFGSAERWNLIVQLNPGLDPNRLQIGQRIKLPARDAGRTTSTSARNTTTAAGSATPGRTSSQPTTTLAPDEYAVQPGDSLARISNRMYGTEGLWEHIYRANQQTIGSDPHRLQVGMKLRIPPRP